MLGQSGLGLPNLAAIGGIHADTLDLVVNQNTIFAPIMVRVQATQVTLNLVTNVNSFSAPGLVWDQTVTLGFTQNVNVIRVASFVWETYRYTYPIGRYPDSDYGMRSSLTYYKRRLIIGRH